MLYILITYIKCILFHYYYYYCIYAVCLYVNAMNIYQSDIYIFN